MPVQPRHIHTRGRLPQIGIDREAMILQHSTQQPPEYATFREMKHMAGKVAVLREKTWELYTKQMTIEKSFTVTGNTFSQLKTRVNTCRSVSLKLKRENSGIEREVGELRGGMNNLARRADDLNKRLDEINRLLLGRKSRDAGERQHRWEKGRPLPIACK